jgi:hypothetical protein
MNDSRPTTVDFWFDPVCPWTWLTSRWILEVRKSRPVDITWHVMSLAVLNEGRLDQLPPQNRELMGQAWAPVRVLIAAQEAFGPGVLEPLYTSLGTQYYLQDQPKTLTVIQTALREAGLPQYLAEAGDTDTYDPILRRSHREGINLVGQEVGSPSSPSRALTRVPERSRSSDPWSIPPPRVSRPRSCGTAFSSSPQYPASTRSSEPARLARSSIGRGNGATDARSVGRS